MGTEVCRECIGFDYWVKKWMEKYAIAKNYGIDFIIVDDIRFNNEAQCVSDLGGIIVKISRPQKFSFKRLFSKFHKSERGIDCRYINEFIFNDGTLKDLSSKADRFVYLGKRFIGGDKG